LALCSCVGAAAHSQTLPKGAFLLANDPASSNLTLFPKQMMSHQTPLPDAPVPIPSEDDVIAADADHFSEGKARKWPDAWQHAATWRPLTGRERLALFWNETYNSPGAFLALSFSALAGQIEDKPAQWSEDGQGYTRHFASAYGQLAARNVIHQGMAAAGGLDPRYIPCNCKGALRRTKHALEMSFATYTRSGRMTLDLPQLAGAYGSGMISTYWYPHRLYNPLVQGVQFGHQEMGEVFVENLFQEFASDMKSALHLR
jgi:hypothetical protein